MRNKQKIHFARNLRKQQTDVERKIWYFLRSRRFGNYKFRRQYVVGQFIVDFCCVEEKIIIEIDGGQHNIQKQQKYDDVRTEYLNQKGYRVYRFWDHEVMQNPERIFEELALKLQ